MAAYLSDEWGAVCYYGDFFGVFCSFRHKYNGTVRKVLKNLVIAIPVYYNGHNGFVPSGRTRFQNTI